MTDWHSKFGSGPAPIGLHTDIIYLQEIEEAALLRAELAMRRLSGKGFHEISSVKPNQVSL